MRSYSYSPESQKLTFEGNRIPSPQPPSTYTHTFDTSISSTVPAKSYKPSHLQDGTLVTFEMGPLYLWAALPVRKFSFQWKKWAMWDTKPGALDFHLLLFPLPSVASLCVPRLEDPQMPKFHTLQTKMKTHP